MTRASTALAERDDTAAAGDSRPGDWARPLLERQLSILGRLAEGGLEIAQAIERQAIERQAAGAPGAEAPDHDRDIVQGDIPLAYARVARAVRMTLLLQSKVIEQIQALDRRAEHEASSARINADAARVGAQAGCKARVQNIVARVAYAGAEDAETAESLVEEAAERLDQDDIYGDVLSRPLSETVAIICRDLGLEPDWPALAEEAWAQAELAGDAPGFPWAGLAGVTGRPAGLAAPAGARVSAASCFDSA